MLGDVALERACVQERWENGQRKRGQLVPVATTGLGMKIDQKDCVDGLERRKIEGWCDRKGRSWGDTVAWEVGWVDTHMGARHDVGRIMTGWRLKVE